MSGARDASLHGERGQPAEADESDQDHHRDDDDVAVLFAAWSGHATATKTWLSGSMQESHMIHYTRIQQAAKGISFVPEKRLVLSLRTCGMEKACVG